MATRTDHKKPMAPLALEGKTFGKYRILEPLGRGGMAQVFKAYHPNLDRYMAVKVLRTELVDDPEFLSRFRREARAVAALRHPNIVQIYDFDVQDDLYYMVMELLDGDTLKAYLNSFRTRGEHIPYGDLLRIMSDVLSGLAFAHSEGIIHRDIKPANIILTKRGQAVITDFGIAQIVGGTQYTVSGALMGTLNYMAPEQGLEGKCDVRSDIYSLGITYYEALTGTVPFDADTPLAILMKHVNDPLPLPSKIDPTIPEAFERVALKALCKPPDDRFQSAAEMAEALAAAGREAGIETPAAINLPRIEVAPKARSKPVAVFSGPARQSIADPEFASGDTEITHGAGKPGLVGPEFLQKAKAFFTPPASLDKVQSKHVGRAALSSVAGLVGINIVMLWLSGIFGGKVFGHTWPMELLAVGVLLAAMMAAMANYWMIVPVGMVMGNGFLFLYFSMTGIWSDWKFLWPLEPLLVAFSILAPFVLKRNELQARWLSRRIGIFLVGAAVVTFLLAMFGVIVLPR